MKRPALFTLWHRSLALLLLAALPPAEPSHAQSVSPFMAYQGYLTDGSGNPLGGATTGPKNYDVIIRIWDLATGGATGGADERYAELQTVTVNNGYFSVLLGKGSQYNAETNPPLPAVFNLPTQNGLYVELTVRGVRAGGADFTLAPRQQLLSAPCAFLAQYAVSAGVATYANNLGSSAAYPQLVSVATNLVSINEPLVVNGAVTVPGLSIGNGSSPTSTLLTANGTAAFSGLNVANVLSAASLTVTNALSTASLTVANVVWAASLTVTNTLSTTSLTVANVLSAASLTVTNALMTNALSANVLSAASVNVTNAVTAATASVRGTNAASWVQVANSLTAMGSVNVQGDVLLTNGLHAVGGDEYLRMVCGEVTNNFYYPGLNPPQSWGELQSGIALGANSFTEAHGDETNNWPSYLITFKKPFGAIPIIMATPINVHYTDIADEDYDDNFTPSLITVSTNGFMIMFLDYHDNAFDQDFQFTALGPP